MHPVDPGLPERPTHPEPGRAREPRHRPFGLYAISFLLSLQALLGVVVTAALGIGIAAGAEDASIILSASDTRQILQAAATMVVATVVMVGLCRYRLWT